MDFVFFWKFSESVANVLRWRNTFFETLGASPNPFQTIGNIWGDFEKIEFWHFGGSLFVEISSIFAVEVAVLIQIVQDPPLFVSKMFAPRVTCATIAPTELTERADLAGRATLPWKTPLAPLVPPFSLHTSSVSSLSRTRPWFEKMKILHNDLRFWFKFRFKKCGFFECSSHRARYFYETRAPKM